MSSRGRSARSRKRRARPARGASAQRGATALAEPLVAAGAQADTAQADTEDGDANTSAARPRGSGARRREARGAGAKPAAVPPTPTFGERPRPPWHPVPLSELLILAGAAGIVIGLLSGNAFGGPPAFAGLLAVSVGTLEVVLREHRSGFKSHSTMLAALPVLILHSSVALGFSIFTVMPRAVNLGMFAVDLALFALLFKLMRASFLTARTRAAGRR